MPQSAERRFFVADLSAQGELKLLAEYHYDDLERIPTAAELMIQLATLVWRSPDEFGTTLPNTKSAVLRWRAAAPTAGIATLRCQDELISLSLYASGLHEAADRITLQAFQQHLLRELHDTGFEPAFDLMNLTQRPLMATINFRDPGDESDKMPCALADRCLAAVYFRSLNLA